MNLVRFEHIEYIWLLVVILIFAVLFIVTTRINKRKSQQFADPQLLNKLQRKKSKNSGLIKLGVFILGFAFLVLGIMNLQFGSKIENVKREGIDVVLAVDLSNSMMSEDIKPNRLERTRQYLYRFIDHLENDRIGIIVFAGNAYVQMPLTIDYSAARLFVSNLNTTMVPTQGTAIGEAITLAREMYDKDEGKHKALIILSDGENHEGNASEAAKEAAKEGIIIHTVGVGTLQGAPIPIYRGSQIAAFQKDKQGNIILSKINESMLQEISAITKGTYFRMTNGSENIKQLINLLNRQDKKEIETRKVTNYDSKFQYFIGLALLMFLLEFLIPEQSLKKEDKQ